jgi:hypothetical protein
LLTWKQIGPDCRIPTAQRTNQIAPFSSGPVCHIIKTYNDCLYSFRDVEISKRLAQPGEKPFDTLRGVGLVKVPIHYVLAYAFDLKYRDQWDDMYLRGILLVV